MTTCSVSCKLPRGVEEKKSHENTLSSEASPPSQCCICLDTLGEADTSNTFAPCKLKPCAHIVCIDCLAQIRGRRCPMCRARMTAFRELTDSALITKEAVEAVEAYKRVLKMARQSMRVEERRKEGLAIRKK